VGYDAARMTYRKPGLLGALLLLSTAVAPCGTEDGDGLGWAAVGAGGTMALTGIIWLMSRD
jgi:hypothetical protein